MRFVPRDEKQTQRGTEFVQAQVMTVIGSAVATNELIDRAIQDAQGATRLYGFVINCYQ